MACSVCALESFSLQSALHKHGVKTDLCITRAHTPRARAVSYQILRLGCQYACNRWRPLPSNTWPVLCAWAESTWTAIGVVDRRGQQKTRFVVPVSVAIQFDANKDKFFAVFDCLIVFSDCSDSQVSRSGDFCADGRQTTDKTDYFTLRACARSNNMHGVVRAKFNVSVCMCV